MDSGSWVHGYAAATTNAGGGNNGFMCGYAASSCTPADVQFMEGEQQQFLISSQIQHHLNQISMRMNMDDEAAVYMSSNDGDTVTIDMHDPIVEGLLDDPHHAGGTGGGSFPSSSSSSISLPASASLSCSPESSILAAPAAAGGGCNQQYPEVSSHVPLLPPPPPPPVVPSYDHQYTNRHAPESPAKSTGAFKHYARHLGPKRPPKPGACGQRMFKTAMSVLSKMHVAARYNQQQYYYQAAAAAAAAAEAVQPPSVNQLQHMFSERKRREKLNDSFHALKAVLPPGAKKDKTSILIRAREYVRSLEAKVAELEEKNNSLELRLTRCDGRRKDGGSGGEDDLGETTTKVQVEITRAANEELCTLTIAVRSPPSLSPPPPPPNMTDVVVRTLQCLKEQIGDGVSLVAMSTSGGGAGPATGVKNAAPSAVLTMQIKSPGTDWEEHEQPVKDAVAKVVADALTTTTTPLMPPAAATTASSSFGEASQLIIRSMLRTRSRMDQTPTPLAADEK